MPLEAFTSKGQAKLPLSITTRAKSKETLDKPSLMDNDSNTAVLINKLAVELAEAAKSEKVLEKLADKSQNIAGQLKIIATVLGEYSKSIHERQQSIETLANNTKELANKCNKTIDECLSSLIPSYEDCVVGTVLPTKYDHQNEPVYALVAKAPKGFTMDQIDKDIRSVLRPSELNVEIIKYRVRPKGFATISTTSENNREIIMRHLKQNLQTYSIELPFKKTCRIIIPNVQEVENVDENVLKARICNQNSWLANDANDIKISKVIKNKFGSSRIIVESNTKTAQKICERGNLYIGLQRYRVHPFVTNIQCLKCGGFKHISTHCSKSDRCVRCNGDHKTRECVNGNKKIVAQCHNCLGRGSTYANHSMSSRKCPIRQTEIANLERKIYNSWISYPNSI